MTFLFLLCFRCVKTSCLHPEASELETNKGRLILNLSILFQVSHCHLCFEYDVYKYGTQRISKRQTSTYLLYVLFIVTAFCACSQVTFIQSLPWVERTQIIYVEMKSIHWVTWPKICQLINLSVFVSTLTIFVIITWYKGLVPSAIQNVGYCEIQTSKKSTF